MHDADTPIRMERGWAAGLEVRSALPVEPSGAPPVLLVHGVSHAAWCWENWLPGLARAGFAAHALSLRGHGASPGPLRTARLTDYVEDVVAAADALGRQVVLVGHSLGGLVVQQALARYPAAAGVLVASTPAYPALGSLGLLLRHHPRDALAMAAGATLRLHAGQLFPGLPAPAARDHLDRLGPESPLAQYGLLLPLPVGAPRGGPPMLVLSSPDDPILPARDARATAARYGADLREFPGRGHDLMLDAGWEEPLAALVEWLRDRLR